jgi:hypothetical protein
VGEQPGERDGSHRGVVGRGDLVERVEQPRALEVAHDEVVVLLQDRELGEPVLALELECGGEPPRRVVGCADVPDGAAPDERSKARSDSSSGVSSSSKCA